MCWVLESISLSTMRAVVLVCKFCKFESPFTSVVSVRHCWALGADNLFHTLQSRSKAYEIREYVSLWKHQHTSGILSISFSARSLQLVISSFVVARSAPTRSFIRTPALTEGTFKDLIPMGVFGKRPRLNSSFIIYIPTSALKYLRHANAIFPIQRLLQMKKME